MNTLDRDDLELASRLERLVAAVPLHPSGVVERVPPTVVRGAGDARRLASGGLVPILAFLVVGTLAAGVARIGPFGASGTPENGPVTSTTTSRDFELTIRSERARYRADERIELLATL